MKRAHLFYLAASLQFFLNLLYACPAEAQVPCNFNTGKIAFTGYRVTGQSDPLQDDMFSFLLMDSLASGAEIYFTDYGLVDANGFQEPDKAIADGMVKWTAPSTGLKAGTQVLINLKQNQSVLASVGTAAVVEYKGINRIIDLGYGGDQLFAFTGTPISPIIEAALLVNKSAWDASLVSTVLSSSRSIAPSASLTGGRSIQNVAATHVDGEAYNAVIASGPVTGYGQSLRAAFFARAFTTDNTDVQSALPAAFALPPAITFTPDMPEIMSGPVFSNGTISVTASNVCSYQWQGSVDGSAFVDLVDGSGYSGSKTNALNISTYNGANRSYRLILLGEGRVISPVFSLNASPVITDLNGSVAWPGVGNTVTLDAGSIASLSDAEMDALNGGLGDYNGASLVVQRSGVAVGADVFGFNTTGASFSVSGNNLQSGGATFATFTNTGGVLTISFASSGSTATKLLVNNVLQRITYGNDTPAGDATMRFTFSDGAASASADVAVTSDNIYITSITDTYTIDISNGVSFSEAVAIAAADVTGTQTLIFTDALSGQTVNILNTAISENLSLDISNASGLVLTGGPITVSSGNSLTFFSSAGSAATISSSIYGDGGINKAGAGLITLIGIGSYTGPTQVTAGTLSVRGSSISGLSVSSGATLAGTGSVKNITLHNGAILSPGATGSDIGTLTVNENLQMNAGSSFAIQINGVTAGTEYDQIVVNGTVSIQGTLSVTHGYTPGQGDNYSIIVNDAADVITGTFTGLAEGGTITAAGNSTILTASYIGGSGNDFTLTAPINAVPVIGNLNGDSGTYIEGETAVLIDEGTNATVTDADSPDFDGGNVRVSIVANRVPTEDVLSIRNQGADADQIGTSGLNITYGGTIIGTRTASGGADIHDLVITLNGAATPDIVQALIRNLTYTNTNTTDPSTSARTVSVTINDGDGGTSTPANVTVQITAVNDAPTLTATALTPTFTEGGTAVSLFSGTSISTIEAGQLIQQLTLTVSNVENLGNEQLIVDDATVTLSNGETVTTPTNGISVSVSLSGTTATVTLSKTAGISTSTLNTIVNGITYRNTSTNPNTANRIITLSSIQDNGGTANGGVDMTTLSIASTVTISAVNDAPVVTTSGGTTAFIEGQEPVVIDAALTVSDPDNTTLTSATVAITGNLQSTQDVLTFTNDGATMGNVSEMYNAVTGVLTLNSSGATATLAQWQSALRAVKYDNTSQNPSTATRTISFTVNDGSLESVAATKKITVTAVNDAPVATNDSYIINEDVTLTVPALGILMNDTDVEGDVLTATLVTGPSNGSLTLNPDGSFTYIPNANFNGTDSFTYKASDGSLLSNVATVTIIVNPVNDAPVVTVPANISVTEDVASPLTGISFSDVDAGANSVMVTLSVPSGTMNAASTMDVTVGGTAETLTLRGSISNINVFIAAGAVTFTTASNATTNVILTVSITDNGNTGGTSLTDTKTTTLVVTAVNDAPVNSVPGAQSVDQDATLVFSAANSNLISISDVDAGGGVVKGTLTATNGLLTLSGINGLSFIFGGNGNATMTFEGSIADINAALNGLVFTPTPGYNGPASLQIITDDKGNSGSGGAKTDIDNIVITVNSISPKVISVSASTANGTYKIDDVIALTVTFDQTVIVNTGGGIPTLLLETGAIDREAAYVSGNGSNTLTFSYTVQAADISADLDYQSTAALSLNGATIENIHNDVAILTLPTVGSSNSIAGQRTIVIDGVVPTITSVAVPANGYYTQGQHLDYALHLSENVMVITGGGTPRLAITIGGQTVYANYLSGSGTNILVFRYTVESDLEDHDGIQLLDNVRIDGGTIKDAAGNNANLSFTAGAAPGIKVDSKKPQLTLTINGGATHTNSHNVSLTLQTTDTDLGTMQLSSDNTTWGAEEPFAATKSWNLTGVDGTKMVYVNIKDLAGNMSQVSATIILDQIIPIVTGVTSGGLYNNNRTITFNEGTATLNNASFTSGSVVTSEGSYTLVVTDDANNTATVIFTIDKTAPIVTGVEHGKSYNDNRTISFNEGTGILDTTPFTSGSTVTAAGTYSLVVTDDAGNVTTVGFTIDKTAPIVTGVEDSKSYNDDRTISFNEGTGTLNTTPFTSGSTVTAEGTYSLVVTDDAGNVTTVDFTIDKTAPIVTGVEDSKSYNDDRTISFNEGTGALDTTPFTSGSTVTAEGTYSLVVTDDAGNVTTVGFTIDKTVPIVTGVEDSKSYNDDRTISFNEGTGILNTAPFTSGSTVTAEGTYSLVVTDDAGNVTTVDFNIDKTAPIVTGVEDSKSYNNDRTISFNEGTGTLNTTPFTSGSTVTAEGTYSLVVTDDAGNVTTVGFTIDKTVPIVTGVEDSKSYNDDRTISFNEGTGILNTAPFTSGATVTAEGTYSLVVTDDAGNVTTVDFKIDKTAPIVTGVEHGKSYNDDRTISFNEGAATLNTVSFISEEIVDAEGAYELIVVDVAGNRTIVNFVIDKTAPAQPTNFVATAGNTEVNVTWDANSEVDLQGYILYSQAQGSSRIKLADIAKGTMSFLHTGLTNGILYQYFLVAADTLGNTSTEALTSATPMGTQSITFTPLADKTYGDLDFLLSASASSGLQVSYTTSDATVAEAYKDAADGNKWKLRITGAGTVDVIASQGGSVAYLPAVDVTQTLKVGKANLMGISFTNATFGYDGTAKSLAINGILPTGIKVSYSGNAQTEAGIYPVTATIDGGNNYIGETLTADLTITKAALVGISFTNATFGYDGTIKSLGVSGILPAGVTVNYSGNGKMEAGTYPVTATIDGGNNYIGETLTADLTISKAALLGIGFANATFVYDGTAKSLAITGTLPTGVTVNYNGNAQTKAGVHPVTATIDGGNNYIGETLTAYLTISKAALLGIGFANASFVYDGTAKSLAITGTLPTGVTVNYNGNAQTKAGVHPVTATIDGGNNYIGETLTADLTITKAALVGINFANASFVYDGTSKSLAITGTLPTGVTVNYNGNGKTEAGVHPVMATIDGGNNYIGETLNADLTITKAALVGINFANATFVYDGTAKSLAITGTLPIGATVSYSGNGKTEAGTYPVTATIDGGNNYVGQALTADLTITKAALVGISFANATFVYDGTAKSLAITGTLPTGVTVGYSGNAETVAGVHPVTATIDGGNNYVGQTLNASLTITKAQQVISFAAIEPVYRDAGELQLDISSNSELPIKIYSDNALVAEVTGDRTVTVKGVGLTHIRAEQDGNANYLVAEAVVRELRVRNEDGARLPVRVNQAVSPNGDGINDYLRIEGIDEYPENKIAIFDANGNLVREIKNYNNSSNYFDGVREGRAVPTGTYFYVLEVRIGGKWHYDKGFFVVKY